MVQSPKRLTNIQVNIRNIELLNNPAKFDDPYNFRIKFEAIAPLVEGKSIYCVLVETL